MRRTWLLALPLAAATGLFTHAAWRNHRAAAVVRESCVAIDGSLAAFPVGEVVSARRWVDALRAHYTDACARVERDLAWWRVLPRDTTVTPSAEYVAAEAEFLVDATQACRVQAREQLLVERKVEEAIVHVARGWAGEQVDEGTGLGGTARAVLADALREVHAGPTPSEEALAAEVEARCASLTGDVTTVFGVTARSRPARAWADEFAVLADALAITLAPADLAVEVGAPGTPGISVEGADGRVEVENLGDTVLAVDVLFPAAEPPAAATVGGREAGVRMLDDHECRTLLTGDGACGRDRYARVRVRALGPGEAVDVELVRP